MAASSDQTDNELTTGRRVIRRFGFILLGAVGTGGIGLLLLNLSQPIQAIVYNAMYLQVGPSEATVTAILTHFLAAGFAALGAILMIGDYWSTRLAEAAAIGKVSIVLLALLLGFLVLAFIGLAAAPTVLVVVGVAVVTIPLLLRYYFGVRSGGTLAFIGGVPVVVLLLLLAGIGIGWGWGYVVTAQEVSPNTDNATIVTFADVPEIQEDLFEANSCDEATNGRRVCYLQLRGSDHERTAVRFLARHGVRCPYQSGAGGRGGSLVTRVVGAAYRVSCSPHGD